MTSKLHEVDRCIAEQVGTDSLVCSCNVNIGTNAGSSSEERSLRNTLIGSCKQQRQSARWCELPKSDITCHLPETFFCPFLDPHRQQTFWLVCCSFLNQGTRWRPVVVRKRHAVKWQLFKCACCVMLGEGAGCPSLAGCYYGRWLLCCLCWVHIRRLGRKFGKTFENCLSYLKTTLVAA